MPDETRRKPPLGRMAYWVGFDDGLAGVRCEPEIYTLPVSRAEYAAGYRAGEDRARALAVAAEDHAR